MTAFCRTSQGIALLVALLAAREGDPIPLKGPELHSVPRGGRIESLRIDPRSRTRILALYGDRAFERLGPGQWELAGPASAYVHWATPQAGREARLGTGETVTNVVLLGEGRLLGLVAAGFVESTDGFRTASAPAGLPTLGVRAVAPAPSGQTEILLCADPSGLYRCPGDGSCFREVEASCTAIQWFDDGSVLAGDRTGGIWHFDGRQWERQRLTDSSIVEITGVPDGGPRAARTSAGSCWLSNDHGATWYRARWPGGRLGSGGMLAWIGDDGALRLRELDGRVRLLTAIGALPADAPLRWASADLIVAGIESGVVAVERRSGEARTLEYPPGGAGRPFLGATVSGGTLQVYSGSFDVSLFEAPAAAPWTLGRFGRSALDGVWWVAGFAVTLGLLFLWIRRVFRTGVR